MTWTHFFTHVYRCLPLGMRMYHVPYLFLTRARYSYHCSWTNSDSNPHWHLHRDLVHNPVVHFKETGFPRYIPSTNCLRSLQVGRGRRCTEVWVRADNESRASYYWEQEAGENIVQLDLRYIHVALALKAFVSPSKSLLEFRKPSITSLLELLMGRTRKI